MSRSGRFLARGQVWVRVAVLAALAALAAAVSAVVATPAFATDVCGDGVVSHPHCYASVPWAAHGAKSWFTGAETTDAQVGCMAVNNPGGWGLNESVWVGNGPAQQPYKTWVEAGLAQGDPRPGAARFAYWAATTSVGNYDEHDTDQDWTANAGYDIQIRESSPSSGVWQVRIAGPGVDVTSGPASPQSTQSYRIDAGLESRDSANGATSVASGLQYFDSGARGRPGWSAQRDHADRAGEFVGNTAGSWLARYRSWRSNQQGEC